MSQRNSEYARMPGDTYVTPRWVYESLYGVEPWAEQAWDCAPVEADFDFLTAKADGCCDSICTNPPFSLAEAFVRHSLKAGFERVAMLLPLAFNAAKGRADLFRGPPFKIKYYLLNRIRWENLEQKKAGPSQNHAWYVWNHAYTGRPLLGLLQ